MKKEVDLLLLEYGIHPQPRLCQSGGKTQGMLGNRSFNDKKNVRKFASSLVHIDDISKTFYMVKIASDGNNLKQNGKNPIITSTSITCPAYNMLIEF